MFRLLVLIVRDSIITLSEIAYNVNNNLDEVLLAIVCTVEYGNIINRSHVRLVENRLLKVSIQFTSYVLFNTFFPRKI